MLTAYETTKGLFEAPTASDYRKTAALFRDFCIPRIPCPKFSSRNALFQWRTNIIKQHLDQYRDLTPFQKKATSVIEQFHHELIMQGASTNTVHAYLWSVRAFIQWYEQTICDVFKNKISAFDCLEYKSYLNTVKHYKPASINANLTALQKYADFLHGIGLQGKIKIERVLR